MGQFCKRFGSLNIFLEQFFVFVAGWMDFGTGKCSYFHGSLPNARDSMCVTHKNLLFGLDNIFQKVIFFSFASTSTGRVLVYQGSLCPQ